MKVTSALTRNNEDMLRVFRRMVFNIAAHNRDDHAKNFAFAMDEAGEWSLAPAYDLGFATGPGGEHTMTVAGEARAPARDHVLQLAKQFGIKPKAAIEIIGHVNAAVTKWPRFAGEAGCAKKSIRTIGSRIQAVCRLRFSPPSDLLPAWESSSSGGLCSFR